MSRLSVSVFVLFACFVLISQARLPKQGQERHLEDSSLKRYVSDPAFKTNFVVKADFGEKFNTTNKDSIGEKSTYLHVFISTSSTGFVGGSSSYFENFACDAQWCTKETPAVSEAFNYPFLYSSTSYGTRATITPFTVHSTDGSEPWKLSTTAHWTSYIYTQNTPYLTYSRESGTTALKSYGWIGLGIDGDNIKNFQNTEEPIFSVNVTGVGAGTIIFGQDSSLFNSDRAAQIHPCDKSWTLIAKNVSLGPLINKTGENFEAKVVFDMNYEYIGVPNDYYTGANYLEEEFKDKYMKYNTTLPSTELGYYQYHGELSALPTLTFGLSNNLNLTIPPEVYMKPIEGFPGYYTTVIKHIGSSNSQRYIVLGSSYLSKYYTVFNKPKTGEPQVTLHPIYTVATTSSPSSNTMLYVIIGAAVAVVLIVIVLKGKGASSGVNLAKKPSTGLELR